MNRILDSIKKTQEDIQECVYMIVEKLTYHDSSKKEELLLSEAEVLMSEISYQLQSVIDKAKRISNNNSYKKGEINDEN